jgi:hypothetical protein
LPSLSALVLGIGLAAIFLLPGVLEYSSVRTDQWLAGQADYYSYANHFVYLFQLFDPNWGFGISVPGPHDGMSFQLGVVPVLLAIFSILAISRNPNGTRRFWLFFLGMTLLVALLMFGVSLPIWKSLSILWFAQFPWRLLALSMVSLAILAGTIALTENSQGEGHGFSLPILLLGALILLGSYPYLTSQMQLQAKEGPVSILGLFKFQQSAGEMTGSTKWVKEIPTWSDMADVYFAGRKLKTKIDLTTEPQPDWVGVDQTGKGLRANGERVRIDTSSDNTPIVFNTFYYPGWRAYLTPENSDTVIRELKIEPVGDLGRMQVLVPAGRYWLILRFEDTPPRIAGEWISIFSVLFSLGLLIWDVKTKRNARALASP